MLLTLMRPFEKKFRITGENAGLHILLTAKEECSEQELVLKAAKKGVKVFAMEDNLIAEDQKRKRKPTLILGYAGMTEKEMKKGVELLYEAWL